MSNKKCIGRCSICGGRVMQYTMLHMVGEWPPAKCERCGAVEDVKGPIIPMRPCENNEWKPTKKAPIYIDEQPDYPFRPRPRVQFNDGPPWTCGHNPNL